MEHRLKTHPVFFADVECGTKKFEVRKNDRDYRVGDFLRLEEYEPLTKMYSGDWVLVQVTYTVHLKCIPGLPDDFIGMSIERL